MTRQLRFIISTTFAVMVAVGLSPSAEASTTSLTLPPLPPLPSYPTNPSMPVAPTLALPAPGSSEISAWTSYFAQANATSQAQVDTANKATISSQAQTFASQWVAATQEASNWSLPTPTLPALTPLPQLSLPKLATPAASWSGLPPLPGSPALVAPQAAEPNAPVLVAPTLNPSAVAALLGISQGQMRMPVAPTPGIVPQSPAPARPATPQTPTTSPMPNMGPGTCGIKNLSGIGGC